METLGNETTKITAATKDQLSFRTELYSKFRNAPQNEAELERNIGLYIRSSLLARIITMSDLYKSIVNIPGVCLDLGCWWGQNSVLMENFRALYEPFNKQREIVAFDTFEGYDHWTDKDQQTDIFKQSAYSTTGEYREYLEGLLQTHEGINMLGHQRGNHKVIKGDGAVTVPKYFKENPQKVVALVLCDFGVYEPTRVALESIKKHLMPGSKILMMHMTRNDLQGDAKAFLDVFSRSEYRIEKASMYPSFSIVTIC